MDFESDGTRLHYELHGREDGRPVVLVHGFASHYRLNWVGTRWQEALTRAGFRVIGLERTVDQARLGGIMTPILVVIGDRDELVSGAHELVEMIPTARLVTVPGRDHLGTVPAREFKQAALEFLD